jgi:hypothetical protein
MERAGSHANAAGIIRGDARRAAAIVPSVRNAQAGASRSRRAASRSEGRGPTMRACQARTLDQFGCVGEEAPSMRKVVAA